MGSPPVSKNSGDETIALRCYRHFSHLESVLSLARVSFFFRASGQTRVASATLGGPSVVRVAIHLFEMGGVPINLNGSISVLRIAEVCMFSQVCLDIIP